MFEKYKVMLSEYSDDPLDNDRAEERLKKQIALSILYDKSSEKCASKVIRFILSTEKKATNIEWVFHVAKDILRLHERFEKSDHFEQCLIRQYKKYNACFSEEKAKNYHTVFSPDAFDYVLDKYISEEDLIMNPDDAKHRQKVGVKEIKFILYKLSKKLFNCYEPVHLARNYLLSIAGKREIKKSRERKDGTVKIVGTGKYEEYKKDEYYRYTRRRLNKEKIAFINRLLHDKRFIVVKFNKNKPNAYLLGKRNPFYHLHKVEVDG